MKKTDWKTRTDKEIDWDLDKLIQELIEEAKLDKKAQSQTPRAIRNRGTKLIKKYLLDNNFYYSKEDDSTKQDTGVDFYYENLNIQNSGWKSVKYKCTNKKFEHIPIEIENHNWETSWLNMTQADEFWFVMNNIIYKLAVAQLKDYINSNTLTIHNKGSENGKYYLISITDLVYSKVLLETLDFSVKS